MKTVILTGSSGFVGRYSSILLKQLGVNVLSAGRSGLDHIFCDLSRPETLIEVNNAPAYDALIHLGAHIDLSGRDIQKLYSVNVLSTSLLSKLAASRGAHFIFASSVAVADLNNDTISAATPINPKTLYGRTKVLAESCIKESGVSATILRIGGIFGLNGPGHLGLNRSISEALSGNRPVIYGDGQGKRNYIYVGDLASILYEALIDRRLGTYCVAGKQILTISEMISSICNIFDIDGPITRAGNSSDSQVICSIPEFTGKTSFVDSLRLIKLLSLKGEQ